MYQVNETEPNATYKWNLSKMTDKELIQEGFRKSKCTDTHNKELLRLVEQEQDKRGIY